MSSLNGLRAQLEGLDDLDQTRVIMACAEGLVGDFAARINRSTDPVTWLPHRRVELLDRLDDPDEIEVALIYLGIRDGENATAAARKKADAKHQADVDKRAALVRGERLTQEEAAA